VTTTTDHLAETGEPRHPASTPKLRHLPALDGYRGLAVAAVVLFHADLVRGGWLGVDVFFVLSGFLITRLVLHEKVANGNISLGEFWRRRGRRLLPALVAVLAGVAVYAAWYPEPELLPNDLTRQMVATLFYVANWAQISSGGGYWDQFATESPLQHMWSLAIEEQFYVLFPLVMLTLFAVAARRNRMAWVFGALAVASWATGVVRLASGTAFDRVYLGTDTRVGAILIGAAVGFLSFRPAARDRMVRASRVLAPAAIAVVVVGFAVIDGTRPWNATRWLLMPFFELCVCVLLVAALDTGRPGGVNRMVTIRPLLWLGAISYGLYLWHIPVLLASERVLDDEPHLLVVGVAIALSLAIAQLSFTVLERPIRRGGLAVAPRFVLAGLALVIVAASLVGVYRSTSAARELQASHEITGPEAKIDKVVAGPTTTVDPETADDKRTLPLARPAGRDPRVLLVGDSMAKDLTEAFDAEAPKRHLSASEASFVGCSVGGMDETDNPDAFNKPEFAAACKEWIDSFPDLLAAAQPDVVVVFRASTRQTIPGTTTDLNRCSPEWQQWYRAALADEIDVLGQTGATVAVGTRPYNRYLGVDPSLDEEIDCVNEAIVEVVADAPHAVLLPVAEWVCPESDDCVEELDGVKLRPDGLHFRGDGAVVASNWIVDQLYGP